MRHIAFEACLHLWVRAIHFFVPTVTFKLFQIWTFWNFYAPNFEKVGDILVSACPYLCIHVRDIVLKLHVWIPHLKIADAYFWFSLNYLPLLNYGSLTNKGMKFCKCRIFEKYYS